MATKKCDECGKTIADYVGTCPACGGSNLSGAFWEFLAGIIALGIVYFLATFLLEIFF